MYKVKFLLILRTIKTNLTNKLNNYNEEKVFFSIVAVINYDCIAASAGQSEDFRR